jgi:hypothetical protein
MHTRKECMLDPRADRDGGEQRLGARELRLTQRRRELEQGERVAACLDDKSVADLRRERCAHLVIDQRPRRRRVESTQLQFGEPAGLEASKLAFAGGKQHDDALDLEPPGDEDECVRGRVVEPVRIVDEAQDRPLLGGVGEQAQSCQRDEEAIVASSGREAERSAKGSGLRWRKVLDVAEDRPDDLVQGREGQMRLRFHSGAAEHAQIARLVARVVQER